MDIIMIILMGLLCISLIIAFIAIISMIYLAITHPPLPTLEEQRIQIQKEADINNIY